MIRYKYNNVRPDGNHMPDCVIRAISLALDLPYYDVVILLYENGWTYDCDSLCISCYEKLLDNHFHLEHYNGENIPISKILLDFPDDILILRIDGHLTCAIKSVINDIWDCREENCTDFWLVKR